MHKFFFAAGMVDMFLILLNAYMYSVTGSPFSIVGVLVIIFLTYKAFENAQRWEIMQVNDNEALIPLTKQEIDNIFNIIYYYCLSCRTDKIDKDIEDLYNKFQELSSGI